MLCAALGLYALRRRINAKAVPEARFLRWCGPAERNGSVGVVWRRCFNHACAFSRGTRSETTHSSSQNTDRGKVITTRTDFVEHENKSFALRLTPAHFFLYQPAATTRRVARIKHEKDDVCFVD